MKVKPNLSYKLLGTQVTVDKDTVYEAYPATNIPDHEKNGSIFIGDSPGILLHRGEYTIVEKE